MILMYKSMFWESYILNKYVSARYGDIMILHKYKMTAFDTNFAIICIFFEALGDVEL